MHGVPFFAPPDIKRSPSSSGGINPTSAGKILLGWMTRKKLQPLLGIAKASEQYVILKYTIMSKRLFVYLEGRSSSEPILNVPLSFAGSPLHLAGVELYSRASNCCPFRGRQREPRRHRSGTWPTDTHRNKVRNQEFGCFLGYMSYLSASVRCVSSGLGCQSSQAEAFSHRGCLHTMQQMSIPKRYQPFYINLTQPAAESLYPKPLS